MVKRDAYRNTLPAWTQHIKLRSIIYGLEFFLPLYFYLVLYTGFIYYTTVCLAFTIILIEMNAWPAINWLRIIYFISKLSQNINLNHKMVIRKMNKIFAAVTFNVEIWRFILQKYITRLFLKPSGINNSVVCMWPVNRLLVMY